MKNISIDIETFSDINLVKCGEYKYAESPAFKILLFGYAVDGSEVQVIDLAQGETIPEEILDALTDESITKWAFNASFERVCLSRYLLHLGRRVDPFHDHHPLTQECARFLNPVGWKCSMIWSAYMGLPLSLEGVGAVLKLDSQKMKEGKDLIRYFCVPCKPTKANGGRMRNLPLHAPEKWATFKSYNKRDVEVEMAIQQRLHHYPVPEQVWDEYHIDQEINDRGIAIDKELVRQGNYEALTLLYDSVPDVLSQLIRTAFVPRNGMKFVVSDFSAIEARVLSWLAQETWRSDVFSKNGDIYCASASSMFGVPVVKHGINGYLRQKGKIAELALGYGGSVGALKAMGALDMGLAEEELQPLVDSWRSANPHIVQFWWDVDRCVKQVIKTHISQETQDIRFLWRSGMLFIRLPSGRRLSYVKPKIGQNRFGGESITYEGIGATKKWERLESYGPKFVENIVQGISRDILCYAMQTLRCCAIVGHVHDELIIECPKDTSVNAICEQMGRTPPWAEGFLLRADGYECDFYKKD